MEEMPEESCFVAEHRATIPAARGPIVNTSGRALVAPRTTGAGYFLQLVPIIKYLSEAIVLVINYCNLFLTQEQGEQGGQREQEELEELVENHKMYMFKTSSSQSQGAPGVDD
jgi:hypothetical protein